MLLTELARHAGVPTRTVRYYADRGLIRPASRMPGGYRIFDESALRQLRFIRRLQGFGLTLRELEDVRHELASLLAGQQAGCSDELCLCNQEQLIQIDRPGRHAGRTA